MKKINFYLNMNSNHSMMSQQNMETSSFELLKIRKAIVVIEYIIIAISTIGIMLNILAFKVFTRKRFDKLAFVNYFKIKLITDSFILLHLFRGFAEFVLGRNLDNVESTLLCKTVEYSLYVVCSISAWMLGLISFDRFVSIVYYQKYFLIKKK